MVNHNVVRGFAKLMRSNYDVWSAHMEAYLQQQGLWDVVTSNCPTNTKYWRAKEERVCQLLKDSIEDKELLQSIQNRMTPKGVWFFCWKMCSHDVKMNNNVSTQDIDGACNQVVHKKDDTLQRNIVLVHPNFLKTLNQLHASWIFGAIAELVDNASDAKATRLDIAVENLYFAKEGKEIPVLAFVDNGHGMSHLDVVRMFSFRCKQTHEGNANRIGRFGIGFKAGTMRLGRDVLVLTQTYSSRSVALFSQLYNEKKEEVESPIITYTRHGHMIVDLDVQSEELSNIYMKAITEFSPFNELDIKELFKSIDENETGTLIYIWNLDKGESDYTLQWDTTTTIGGTSHQIEGDIQIRSRRRRSRLGQKNSKVSLDYSLQAYLEVFFLNPRMKIYVQDSLVKCRPLAKFLNRTITYEGQIMGKPIKLTLGRSQEAWEQTNSGIFLYWHGRLIEAYKKGPIILGDTRCGMIGVIDVTNIMDDGNKNVWILNNKQGFHDCNAYCELVQWLECRETEYWKQNYISVFLGNPYLKPDNEWVQCSNCHEWRMLSTSSEPEPWCMLSTNSDVEALPELWFCSMPPFDGRCETPMRNAVMKSKTVPILGELRAKLLRKHSRGSAGTGFTPHVITVKAGEDVSSKIMSFSQNGPRAVCILSANGAISNVTLRQAATSGGTVTYEGRFEILSLSGSFLLSESGGQRSRTGGLSVSLAGPDGRVLGGGVAGLLTAASPVQVVVGSFIADGKKEPKHTIPIDPSSAPGKLASSVPMAGANSPPSRGTLSESSGGPGSPMNQSTGGTCNNSNQQGISSMPWK